MFVVNIKLDLISLNVYCITSQVYIYYFKCVYFQNLKHAKSRRDQFSQGSNLASLSDSSSLVPKHNSLLMSSNQCAINMDNNENQDHLQQVTQQTQAMAVYDNTV